MPEAPTPLETKSLRSFWITLILLNVGLAIGGSVGADRLDVSAGLAVPIVAAFLLQISVYLVAVFPEARARLEARLSKKALAGCLVAVSVVPYLVYSLPTGVFSVESLLRLLAFCVAVAYAFVWFPPKGHRFQWQDVVVLLLLAYPMVGGASYMFQQIYRSPGGNVPEDVYALGKVMLIPLGAMIYLCLRRLEGANFQLPISARDFTVGVKNYLLFLPIGIPLTLGIGFAKWAPYVFDSWTDPLAVFARIVGLYAAVALAEELYFRGILQNLLAATWGRPRWAQFTASVFFGLAHVASRGFPNWRYALAAAFAGWFYGRAYNADRSVVAAAVTHTLVAGTHAFIFPPV